MGPARPALSPGDTVRALQDHHSHGALRMSGLTATAIFEGGTNGRRLLDYVTDILGPVVT